MQLRLAVPVILAAFALLDGGLRLLLPREAFAFRAWEAVTAVRPGLGPFRPSYRFALGDGHGDLAANRPEQRQRHAEVFSTDSIGFRRPGCDASDRHYDVVVLGDSFAAGSGLSDDSTFAARLAQVTELRVCDASGLGNAVRRTTALLERLPLAGTVVVWQTSERAPLPAPAHGSLRGAARLLPDPVTRWVEPAIYAPRYVQHSPLQILANRAFRTAWNGRLLPPLDANRVVERRLRNGASMLFLKSELDHYCAERNIETAGVREVAAMVRSRGGTVLVLPVPDKYAVYAPLLQTPAPECGDGARLFVDREASQLREDGVDVVGVASELRERARSGLAQDKYVYWLDDTHWTPLGVAIVADIAAVRIRQIVSPHPVASPVVRRGGENDRAAIGVHGLR